MLRKLCLHWQMQVSGIPASNSLPLDWGISTAELGMLSMLDSQGSVEFIRDESNDDARRMMVGLRVMRIMQHL